jgi:HAE1 family hydrophobic/amphiphilic exporter-1
MVVDNSIVVLENIYRHSQMGESKGNAASFGTNEVWGAVLASTLTTIAVFLPVIFVEEEAGQLFRDIAIAISFAVLLSMVISITVIPSLASRIIRTRRNDGNRKSLLTRIAGRFTNGIAAFVYWLCGKVISRLAVVCVLTVLAFGMAWFLAPKTESAPLWRIFSMSRLDRGSLWVLLREILCVLKRLFLSCGASSARSPA